MKLTKCEHGHVFDGDKFAACPYCAGKTDAEIMGMAGADTAPAEAAAPARSTEFQPVQGWLVAVSGPAEGHDFRLTAGRNFVGASAEMEVNLSADPAVASEHAASVVFDPQSKGWFVHPCETKQLFYRNEAVVLAPQELNAGDTIRVGDTTLAFVPFEGYTRREGE